MRLPASKPAGGKGGSLTWDSWGKRAFSEEELRPALEDLRATDFRRFRHNFLRFNTTPAYHHTPDGFRAVVRQALETADEFVWIYSETPRWWSPEGGTRHLPAAYDSVLRAVRR